MMNLERASRKAGEPMFRRSGMISRLLSWRGRSPAGLAKKHNLGICGEEGAGLVEFALASVVLVTMLFGTFETCLAVYSYDYVSEATRDAARYAIVRGANCSTISTSMPGCNATSDQIQTYVRSLNYPGIVTSNLNATAVWYQKASSTTNMTWTSCDPTQCNAIGNAVQVKVTYTFPLSVPFISSSAINMSNSSMMVISQ